MPYTKKQLRIKTCEAVFLIKSFFCNFLYVVIQFPYKFFKYAVTIRVIRNRLIKEWI